jgi:CubicO group peptidase (beta-lactamase class C family)
MSAQTGKYVPELHTVDKAVLKFMKQWEIPGASVAIAKDGKLIYARGFGYANIERSELVQPFHRFRIASISKPLTATAIFKLIDEGKLSLEDKVFGSKGILNNPAYMKIADPRCFDITVEQLLSHTSGWIRHGDSNDPMINSNLVCEYFHTSPPATQQQIIQYMLAQKLDFTPGSRQEYLNFGYCVLGRIIEKVTNQSYEEYVKKNILNVIGLESYELAGTFEADKKKNEVTYYDRPQAELVPSYLKKGNVQAPYGGFNITAMDAHGGWIASASDLLKFALAVDGRSSRPDVLSSSSIDSMSTHPFPSANFAHGWNSDGKTHYHFGLLPGSSGFLEVESNDLAVALLFNSYSFSDFYFQSMMNVILTSIDEISSFPTQDLFVADQPL